ncbi:MAG TPA: MATE family efflux transporter [Phenylobacterium sp.]|nr:MATE family efflux transporter [Phenylobacterium sp.]
MSSAADAEPAPAKRGPPVPHGARDLTTGPIGWTLITYSLPVLGTNVLQSLNGSANAFWVSHSLGPEALAATSNANLVMFLLLGAGFGLSMAANILISQAAGAKDYDLVKRIVGTSAIFYLVLSTAIAVAGFFGTSTILDWVQAPPDVREPAIAYLQVVFLAIPAMYFINVLMMAQRGIGDSRTPFWFSVFAIGLDIGLNPVLILGLGPAPQMGIAGSSTAMLISQVAALIAMVAWLYFKRSILVLRPEERGLLKPDLSVVRTLVVKGVPMALQMFVLSGAALVMMGFVNHYGSDTAAAYGAASQIWAYVQMPAMAVGASVSSMAGQYVGAGKMDRLNRVALVGVGVAVGMTLITVASGYIFARPILSIFLPAGSEALDIAVHLNKPILWGFVLFSATFAMTGIVRATGAVTPPLIILAFSLWGVRAPFAWLLQPHIGADAIWWSFPAGSVVSLVLGGLYWRFGNWRNQRLLDTIPPGVAPDAGMGTPAVADEDPLPAATAPSARHRPAS